jgi:hypothetical protein
MVTLLDEDTEFAGPVVRPFEEAPSGGASATVLEVKSGRKPPAPFEQLTMDGSEPVPVPVPDPFPDPVALVFPSRHDGPPHVVSVFDFGPNDRAVLCRCEATKSLALRPKGCWAMQKARRMLAIPEPE